MGRTDSEDFRGRKNGYRKTRQEATEVVWARDNGMLMQKGKSGNKEK